MPALCTSVPKSALKQYVPRATRPDAANPAHTPPTERYADCSWDEPPTGKPGEKAFASRQLRVAVRLHLDAKAGLSGAKAEYDAEWSGASARAGTAIDRVGRIRAEAPQVVDGLGDHAFTQHRTVSTILGRTGVAETVVRLRNAVLIVQFRGFTTALDRDGVPRTNKSQPMAEATALAGAETAARAVTLALATCGPCLTR